MFHRQQNIRPISFAARKHIFFFKQVGKKSPISLWLTLLRELSHGLNSVGKPAKRIEILAIDEKISANETRTLLISANRHNPWKETRFCHSAIG